MSSGKQKDKAESLSTKPGRQHQMDMQPVIDDTAYVGSRKLEGKVALITGGDSGIGQAVAVAFAKEGADIAFCYLEEDTDANTTVELVESYSRRCTAIKGDVGNEAFCQDFVMTSLKTHKHIDILVNNASEQFPTSDIQEITKEQLDRTFRSNIYSMFFMVKAALPYLTEGSRIINTTSVTAYRGSPGLLDYSATKGAITSFTRSLSEALAEKGIHVNAVAPGPIWTPLIPSTFPRDKVKTFGQNVPLGRAGQPAEVAPAYVYLASSDSSYVTGQVLHVNGGEIING